MIKKHTVGHYSYYMETDPKPFDRSKLLSPEKRKKALDSMLKIIDKMNKIDEEYKKKQG